MSEREVEIVSIEGKNYKRVIEDEIEYWCVKTIALNCGVTYQSIYYHLSTKQGIFDPFIRSFKVILNDGKMRDQLFLMVPDGLDQLRLYVRKLKDNPEMNNIMKFISDIRKGDIVAATKEDVNKLKQAQAKTQHLVLGHDMSSLHNKLDHIMNLLVKQQNGSYYLPQQELMDSDRKRIIKWLLEEMAKSLEIEGFEMWWEFSGVLGIDNYARQPKEMFPKMLDFFFERDRRLVVRAYNWYNSQQNPKDEIKHIFLDLIEKSSQKKINDTEVYM